MKKLRFILLLLCMIAKPGILVSQDQPPTRSRKAAEAYNNGIRSYSLNNYTNAINKLLEAIHEDARFIDAYLVLAEVYEDNDQPHDAIRTYRQAFAINDTYYPYGWIRLGNLEYKEALYRDAKLRYEKYLEISQDNTANTVKAKDGIARCDFAIHAINSPVEFKPVNLGPSVNTENDEYWPSLSADEKILVITRLLKSHEFINRMQEDFFISHYRDEGWTFMLNAGEPLNTNDNEGAQALSGDGRFMVFTACNRSDGLGRCDLYYSVKEGNQWSIPLNMGSPVNTAYRETQPSLSSDGRTVYFSSDRPGGKGSHDLWVSNRDEKGNWTVPVNLGDSINTVGIEMSPFIHPDSRTLYFSSDGHIGMGGYDIFMSQLQADGNWKRPVNLGYPINTNRDEIGMIVNSRGDKAYYSSDIDARQGKDIFTFEMPVHIRPDMVTYMKGKIFDAKNDRPLKAQFELTDLNTGNVINISHSDSITGEFLVCIPTDHNYMLNVSKEGYLFFSENFALLDRYQVDDPFLKDIPLQPLQVGVSTVLKNIFYETDSFALKKESEAELMKIVKFMQENAEVRIEISGHTDNTGNASYNQVLSENRARIVAEYLINASIDSDRLTYSGYGMNIPIASNDSEANRAQNRRTELKIIE
ncbi:MAG: PD40 domain-containing protein [Bacteroidales bacterium]|nr:PD40 domain-containing protein [Bacteroidales bacterium]